MAAFSAAWLSNLASKPSIFLPKTMQFAPQTNSLLYQQYILWDSIGITIVKGICDFLRPSLQNNIPPQVRYLGNMYIVNVSQF